jgi:hypothetical protein
MRSQHIWTEKDRHGKKREVRATKFGGVWRFQSKIAGETEWAYYDTPPLRDLLHLKEIIARKYQRRRASFEDVVSINKLIEEQAGNE